MQYRPSDLDDIDTTYDAVSRLQYAVYQLWDSILSCFEGLLGRIK